MISLWKKFLAWRSKRPVVPFFSSWLRDYEPDEKRNPGASKRTFK